MKAILKVDYPKFDVELVSYDGEVPPDQVAPEGMNLLGSYQFAGGSTFLNVISEYHQHLELVEVIDAIDVPAETGVLVVVGSVSTNANVVANALNYIKPKTKGFTIEGEAIVYLVS